jgi:hypothetical protein
MKCSGCEWMLHDKYQRYKTVRGEPLCQSCYISMGGVV